MKGEIKNIKRSNGECKKQSSWLKIQTVNEHRWWRPSHYTVTCRGYLSAWKGCKGNPTMGRNSPCSLFPLLLLANPEQDFIFQHVKHTFPCSSPSYSSGSSSLALSKPFAPQAGWAPARSFPLTEAYPCIEPFLWKLPASIPCAVPLFKERFAVNYSVLESPACPRQALQELWSCPITPYASPKGESSRIWARGGPLTVPHEPQARKGFTEQGSETHLQALLSFHLQEKRDLQWCLARLLASSSHVQ